MRQNLTEQQVAFFTRNGYLELEGIPFDHTKIFLEISSAIQKQKKALQDPRDQGRDLWRLAPVLQKFAIQKLSPSVLSLKRHGVRLAYDQWIPSSIHLGKPKPLKDLFSIQGVALGAILCSCQIPNSFTRRIDIGISPLPTNNSNVLFVQPHILLDWPLLTKLPPVDLYIIAYALPKSAVYIHNPQDSAAHWLKCLGYEFGDTLRDTTHPLIR